jgi:diketogulonate reductase-like aldo/keto reductase
MTQIPTKKLSSGVDFPVVGLGTYKADRSKPDQLSNAIKAAIKSGYRHFDCALCYENEDIVGTALRDAIKESNGQLKREDFFIVSKLWNTYHSKEEVPKCIQKQLDSFGLDYLDLYLMHWPFGFKEATGELYPTSDDGVNPIAYSNIHYLETYTAMEELVRQGKVKSIGVSNFNIEQLTDVLANCKVKPVTNQFEVHPYCQNTELIEFCQKNGVIVTNYAPLGAPDRGWLQKDDPIVLEDPVILNLAKKYNKTPGQICLRWAIQRDLVTIPKSVTPSRIQENIEVIL